MSVEVTAFKEANAIPVSLKKQIIACYHDYFPPRIFEGKNPNDWFERGEDKPVRFVLLENEAVVSHVGVITREVTVNGTRFRLAGLGGIFTRTGYRKRGFGSRIIRAAMEYVNKNEYDVAVLFCMPENRLFYEKLGFQVLPNQLILVGKDRKSAKSLPKEELCMIYYLSEKSKHYKQLFKKIPIFFGEEW